MAAPLHSSFPRAAVLEALRAPQSSGMPGSYLPDAAALEALSAVPHAFERAPSLSDFHAVLLMEAGPERNALATGLWDAGMLVTSFRSPHEAEAVLSGEPVHAVLMDAQLGPQLAPQVSWWLQAMGRGAVKVVVFGDVDGRTREALLTQGVSWVVPRPSHPGTFARQLVGAMGFHIAPNR